MTTKHGNGGGDPSAVAPILRPGYNPYTYREPNAATIAKISTIADRYHAALAEAKGLRAELDAEIRQAKADGHSYSQLSEAARLGIATLQEVINGRRDRGRK